MRRTWVAVARGDELPDLVLRGGRVLSVFTGEVFRADVAIVDGHIAGVGEYDGPRVYDASGQVLIPGFIDGHCHIESSKLNVDEFARAVLPRGTTTVVVDPHELANVLGMRGVHYVLQASEGIPLGVYVMAPSCVPASPLESPAQSLEACDYEDVLSHPRVLGIAELMNYPAAIAGDPAIMAKMALVGYRHVDGHAPGVTGRALNAYLVSGARSDHECTTLEEALEKKRLGMWIMIREASMIRNLLDLLPLVTEYGTDNCLFVTDDREADTLLDEGHMNAIVRKAVAHGLPAGDAVKLASLNVARYHGLSTLGAVAPGYRADILAVSDLESFEPAAVFAAGALVAEGGKAAPFHAPPVFGGAVGTVRVAPVTRNSFAMRDPGGSARVVQLVPDQVVTRATTDRPTVLDGRVVADPERDLAKVAVVERHHATGRIGLGLVRGFGLERGAMGSSVAHDAHNLVIVGADDGDMARAVAELERLGGGIVVVAGGEVLGALPLEIAGLMSTRTAQEVAAALEDLHGRAWELGVRISTPFMYLSFLALSVIPEIRVTDRGIVDVAAFRAVPLGAS